MSSIPLPALQVSRPQDPLESFQRLVQRRNASVQRDILQQQAQAGQLENQQRQQALSDQQAMTKAMGEWDGKDIENLPGIVLKHGGSANAVFGLRNQIVSYQKNLQEMTKDQLANEGTKNDAIAGHIDQVKSLPPDQQPQAFENAKADLMKRGYLDPQQAQGLTYGGPQQLDALEKFYQSHTQQVESALKAAQTTEATNKGNLAATEASEKQQQAEFFKKMGLPPGIAPEVAQFAAFLQKGGKPEGYAAYKAQQEAAATQPFKIQTAQVEAQTRMAMEGMAKPVYAYDPRTDSTKLMSQTEALQAGMRAIRPVTAKEVSEDTMLNNRLADVHQKIAEYEQALQKPISGKDQSNLAALLGTHGIKVGAFGTEIPMDRLNSALNKENLSGLSANARDQLVAYRNAREALTGYTRVLTGSGRSSDKNLELQEQTLPDPSITDPDFSTRALGAFKQNLHVVGQGLPELPGIKSPKQVEQEVWGNQGQGGNQQLPSRLLDLLHVRQ